MLMLAMTRALLRQARKKGSGCGGGAPTARYLRQSLRQLRAATKASRQVLDRRRQETARNRPFATDARTSAGGDPKNTAHRHPQPSPEGPSGSSASSSIVLPVNPELESALAFIISENGDARVALELTQRLLRSTLLSLASPVGHWDPYNVQPQVFALDTYFALPVFTSITYLQHFCEKFRFQVRDPSGVLWADGLSAEDQQPTKLALPDVSRARWNYCNAKAASSDQAAVEPARSTEPPAVASLHPEVLADLLTEDAGSHIAEAKPAPLTEGGCCAHRRVHNYRSRKTRAKCCRLTTRPSLRVTREPRHGRSRFQIPRRRVSRKRWLRRRPAVTVRHAQRRPRARRKRGAPRTSAADDPEHDAAEAEKRNAFWAKVAAARPFGISKATPLPIFGPMMRPFFVGYFADLDTLLHNIDIVPQKVDLILNPASPLEYVIAREVTNCILSRERLVLLAYEAVERTLRGEFHRFFAQHCPEVEWASSACVPRQAPECTPLNELQYDIAIVVQSDSFSRTLNRIAQGKRVGALVGHSSLQVLPTGGAAPFVRDGATRFYERELCQSHADTVAAGHGGPLSQFHLRRPHRATNHSVDHGVAPEGHSGGMGVFRRRGPVHTINVAASPNSYFHDPSNAYTESHAIFTEDLKLGRR